MSRKTIQPSVDEVECDLCGTTERAHWFPEGWGNFSLDKRDQGNVNMIFGNSDVCAECLTAIEATIVERRYLAHRARREAAEGD